MRPRRCSPTSRASRGHSLLAFARLWAFTRGHPRPRSGDLLRAQAHLPPVQRRGAGRWRGAAPRYVLRAARWQRSHPVDLGAHVKECLEAAERLEEEGISAEVIDVATLKPLDFATIHESVRKTGRCVIVHEAPRHCGVGAEIAARLAEEAIYDLQAPVARVTGYDVPIPLFRLEMKYLPSVERIVAAAKRVLAVS